MRIRVRGPQSENNAYALAMALCFVAAIAITVATLATWTASSSMITARNNNYMSTVGAAEAATEVVIAQLDADFMHQALSSDMTHYAAILPSTFVTDRWVSQYAFNDGNGNPNQTSVTCSSAQVWTNLASEFVGLYGLVTSVQITSYATMTSATFPVTMGVRQNIQLSTVPVFQFALDYSLDMEINPGEPMTVTGKTHSNMNLYAAPPSTLTFADAVSAVGQIYNKRDPNDPTGGASTMPIYQSTHLSQVSSFTLPMGVGNNVTNAVAILDTPPSGEDPHSQLGSLRYYNQADLAVLVSSNAVSVSYNAHEDGTTLTPVATNAWAGGTNSGYTFVNTNLSFYDYREGKQVLGTELDVGALTNWLATAGASLNMTAQTQLGHPINSVYIKDIRSASRKLTAVRITDGQYLPSGGLSVATPQPLYVKGNFNAPDTTAGSTNTSNTLPASFACDAITVLSPNWNDSWTSGTGLGSRNAVSTSVNAGVIAGIVPSVTVGGVRHYSGGVENFFRLLENWSGCTLTYNGSIVAMYASRNATNFWINTGTYYNAPTRKWAFDVNFLTQNRLPPCTPQVRKLQRVSWNVVAPTAP
ncbi:MAG: hypothetical protein ABSH34_01930 [Verrucomicrobiota bacterium]|jgi:hypothetical protein